MSEDELNLDEISKIEKIRNRLLEKLAHFPRQFRQRPLFEDWSKRIATEKVSYKLTHRLSKHYNIIGGKWMIFLKLEEVDAAWEKVCRAIHEGKFPQSTTGKAFCIFKF